MNVVLLGCWGVVCKLQHTKCFTIAIPLRFLIAAFSLADDAWMRLVLNCGLLDRIAAVWLTFSAYLKCLASFAAFAFHHTLHSFSAAASLTRSLTQFLIHPALFLEHLLPVSLAITHTLFHSSSALPHSNSLPRCSLYFFAQPAQRDVSSLPHQHLRSSTRRFRLPDLHPPLHTLVTLSTTPPATPISSPHHRLPHLPPHARILLTPPGTAAAWLQPVRSRSVECVAARCVAASSRRYECVA